MTRLTSCAVQDCMNLGTVEGPGGFYFCPGCVAEWERTLEEVSDDIE